MITVSLLCYQRFEHFEDIIRFWLRQPKVTQVIVMDNSGAFKTDLPVLVINLSENYGPIIRYMAAQFAKNDIMIFCDDDANHGEGISEDLLRYYDEDKIMGIIGLRYIYKDISKLPRICGYKINKPEEVDYVAANTMITHRKHCFVDIRKCPYESILLEDMWWIEEVKIINPKVSIWIVPTNKVCWYPEGSDENAIHRNPETVIVRQRFYEERGLGPK